MGFLFNENSSGGAYKDFINQSIVVNAFSENFIQTNVKEGKLFSPDQSAGYLLDVINTVDAKDTGKVFAWDGQE